MSDEQQDSTQSTAETPAEDKDNALKRGVDWVAKHWPRVRLGHEGMMLEKIQRQSRCVETLARNTMTGKMGDVTGWPSSGEEEDMGVNIGDHIHYHMPATSSEANGEAAKEPDISEAPQDLAEGRTEAPAEMSTKAVLTTLSAVALASALLPAIGVTLASALGAFDKPAATQFLDTDTTRRLEMEKFHP